MRPYRPPSFYRHQYHEDPDMRVFGQHHHNHETPWDEAPPWAIELGLMASLIIRHQESIMIDTTALVGAAQRVKKDNADLIAALTAIRDQNVSIAATLKDVQAQLAASTSPDTSAQEAAIAGVVNDLTKVADDTEAAVAANQSVPDLPPAPVT